MPAPTTTLIEANLTQTLLAAGIRKRAYVNGALVETAELPDAMKAIVRAQAKSLAMTWMTWQGTAIVQIPATSVAGTPSVGLLP